MPRILSSALNLHKNSGFFKLDAVVFGSDDYCADIGTFVYYVDCKVSFFQELQEVRLERR